MYDFRLKVFYSAAKRLNFTKAAEELFITQPAVTKHIHEIESYFNCKLFDRNGTKLKLTEAGLILLKYTEELAAVYQNMEFDLATINEDTKGTLRIGASTTVAQYFLPRYLAVFKNKFRHITLEMTTHNTETIENLLSENKIDIGIVEGQSKRRNIKYLPLIKDEIVLCAGVNNHKMKKNEIRSAELTALPLVIRENGSGSLEVIMNALKNTDIDISKLTIEAVLDSSESIKAYLQYSDAFAFLSMHSVYKELKNNELKIIDIKNLDIRRHFYIIGSLSANSPLSEKFVRYMFSHNFKL